LGKGNPYPNPFFFCVIEHFNNLKNHNKEPFVEWKDFVTEKCSSPYVNPGLNLGF